MPDRFHENVETVTAGRGTGSLSVYIHLPFCRVKCTYCAFAISTDQRLEERYVSALIEEMRRRVPPGAPLETLYFGGGTPSRLSRRGVERLGDELGRWRGVADGEVTLEANPEDVDHASLDQWTSALGVNRLSIGVQSFHEPELTPLGRAHGRSGALEAIELASRAVPRISVDLILGLPGQTVESVRSSGELGMSGPVGHLSLYILDLEPGSALEQRVSAGLTGLPSDEVTADMYKAVTALADDHGLRQYEVSNFARPGEESNHNLRYWKREPYIGVGLGAHSFDGKVRSANTRSIREYLEMIEGGSLAVTFEEALGDEEVRHERLFLGLRRTDGIPLDELRDLAGGVADAWLDEAVEQQWVTVEGDRVRFTIEGFLVSDELLAELF